MIDDGNVADLLIADVIEPQCKADDLAGPGFALIGDLAQPQPWMAFHLVGVGDFGPGCAAGLDGRLAFEEDLYSLVVGPDDGGSRPLGQAGLFAGVELAALD